MASPTPSPTALSPTTSSSPPPPATTPPTSSPSTPSPPPPSSTSSPPPPPPPPPSSSTKSRPPPPSSSSSTLAVAGIAIAGMAVLVSLCLSWKKRRRSNDRSVRPPLPGNKTPQERPNLEMTRKLEDKTTVDDGASSSIAPGSTHEVFLSFRGVDTRKVFTDHLYNYFTSAGVETFRDNEKLRVGKKIGPDLMKAIEESSISIPIFSKDYASSKWCLRELTHMVKCMKDIDPEGRQRHTVCPIFYNVTPSDVRHQTGSFAEAFLKHTNDKEVDVQKWKDALKEVCELKGWEKDQIANGHEAELVMKVVREVCQMLKTGHVILTDKLVGMDYHVEEMTKLMDRDSGNGAQIVGIVGMGGIGKTTIAKFMYNKLCGQFRNQCSFLEDVRERVKHNNGCAELRKQLISDVLKRPVDEIKIDKDIFRDKKVLIVLDDVEKRSQLTDIIGVREHFGSGSRIIVTTRKKDIFVKEEGDLIYEPGKMNYDDSLLLFCKHAFKKTQPDAAFEDISREVVQKADGLPLFLVVIGSMLFNKKGIKYWKGTLDKLKDIPAEDVLKRLKISYDALDNRQKQLFLDIACHFIGEDITLPCYMWEDCKDRFNPGCDIDNLVYLSLITIGEGNVFRMHDQLRDLGRYIVNQENPDASEERSRLWSHEEAVDTLKNQSGTRTVQTLSVNYRWDSDCIISNDDFKGLSTLRYLRLEGSTLKGDFNGLFSNLRWFTWRFKDSTDALEKSIMTITNFRANKLVVLDLSGSDIRDGWESWIQIKASTNLKVLKLSHCYYLTKLPECLWNMKSLVVLNLSHTEIAELPERGIENLTNLIKLLLSYNTGIKRLPDAIGKLKNLEVLDCSKCSSLEGQLPEGIWRLSSLRVLKIRHTKMYRLLKNVVRLCNSRNLNLSDIGIKKLPGVSIEMLQKLKELNYFSWGPMKRELTDAIERLSSLRVLDKTADSSTQERSNLKTKRKLEDVTTVDDGASSSTASGSTGEVFLSFRGTDIHRRFTNHLYSMLTDVGIRTFMDDDDWLHAGEMIGSELMKAMEESSIVIPIFSKGYASSVWCLMELTHMIKCMKSNHGHTIRTIFYGVTPFEVSHQTGSFHKAFLKHSKKFRKSMVQEWKDSLKEVCEFKGWEKAKIADGHETKLVMKVVREVCKILKNNKMSRPDVLIGMDHHREEMTKLLKNAGNGVDNDGDDVGIVGIVGMDGIGKTTIAKFMYNKFRDQFQPQCSFLEGVRERVKRNGCAELQKQLISDVLKHREGTTTIDRDTFRANKVLIVVDDVEDRFQLEEIIGGRDSRLATRKYFGPGSRIIVTTRNKDVFIKKEGDLIYEPGEMNYDDSLLLFCEYAFKRTRPEEGFVDISRKVVQTAAGLPLSLVVIGSMLYSKEIKEWEATLEKLKVIPPLKVQERLKISYDALDHGHKQIFLDIACHFIGEDKAYAMYLWEDCGFFPDSRIDDLNSLSLITIGEGNVFRMHDQLRDLGRNIVYQENPDASEERSRLWSHEEAVYTLKKRSGKKKVQTLHIDYLDQSSYCHSDHDFKGMSKLRYLHLGGNASLEGDFKGLLPELRWFKWTRWFPGPPREYSSITVTNFCPPKLIILDLSRSDIRDDWESWIQIKELTNLKVLNLSYCLELTRTPDFFTLSKLERLNLQGCENLTEIGSSVKHLKRLTYFNAKHCPHLRKLPPGFGSLTSLRELHLDSYIIYELTESMGFLSELRYLSVI